MKRFIARLLCLTMISACVMLPMAAMAEPTIAALDGDLISLAAIQEEAIYSRPTAAQILADFEPMKGVHPRIMATAETFERLTEQVKTNEYLKKWYENVLKSADNTLSAAHTTYTLGPSGHLQETSQRVLSRALVLGMAWQITGDDKYAEYLWGEYEAVGNFQSWRPYEHYLDTAEMTNAVAIGYDWCYDYWVEHGREKFLEEIIMNFGLQYGEKAYAGDRVGKGWVSADHNWNAVCNGGMAVGALALMDIYPERCAAIVQNGLRSLESMLGEFAPDGGWGEGPVYWEYCIAYYVYHMAAMNTALGTDYGYSELPGLRETCYYPAYNASAQGVFNIGDARPALINSAAAFFFGKRLGDARLITLRLTEMEMYGLGGGVRDLLFYDPGFVSKPDPSILDLDRYIRHVETATFRSVWNDNKALFAGIHGGDNLVNHGNLDGGTFVLDALGERWAWDLGPEAYHLGNYFDDGVDGKRWNYYRCNTQGQNVLTLNPVTEKGQYPGAYLEISSYESKPKGGYAVVNMKDAYPGKVTYARRGMLVDRETEQVVVQDELNLTSANDLWWFMHTKADVEIGADGKTAVLTQGGKLLYAVLECSDSDATFTVMKADPLPGSPIVAGQDANADFLKLAIHLPQAQGELSISVRFIPLSGGKRTLNAFLENNTVPGATPIATWAIPEGEIGKQPRITAPANGSILETGKETVICVDTADVADIQQVEFYVNGVLAGTASQAEKEAVTGATVWQYPWKPQTPGQYRLSARLCQRDGQPRELTAITVTAYQSAEFGRSTNFSNLKVNNTGTGISGFGLLYTDTRFVYSAETLDSAHGVSLKLHTDGGLDFGSNQALNVNFPADKLKQGSVLVAELEVLFTNGEMGLFFAGHGDKRDGTTGVWNTAFRLADGAFTTGGAYQENTWYKVKVVYNLEGQYFDAYVDDVQIAAYQSFAAGAEDFWKFDRMKFMYTGSPECGAGDVYIDNVRFAQMELPIQPTVKNGVVCIDGSTAEFTADVDCAPGEELWVTIALYRDGVLTDVLLCQETAAGLDTPVQSKTLTLEEALGSEDVIRGYIWRSNMNPLGRYLEWK